MECDAIPPSSPPHATTDRSNSPFFEPRYNTFSPKSSSPPPLFSSDDSRESADLVNYESPRIFKNKRKGAWWNSPESPHGTLQFKKAKLTRNFDSGVYMMSDNTDSSESLLPPHRPPFGLDTTCDALPHDELPHLQTSDEEDLFCGKLYEGLDRNSQAYNFSSCNLQDTDIRRIGELASVIRDLPDPGRQLPAEGQYRSMVPELYVNLSHNKLHRLTRTLFDVQNLTTLVLVDNDIQELPACINRLHNLQELNISQNKIMCLPFDFLEIYHPPGQAKLELIGDSGVPWLQPKTRQELAVLDPMFRQLRRELFEFVQESGPGLDLALAPHLQRLYDYADACPDRERFLWYLRGCEMFAEFYNKRTRTPTGFSFTEDGFFSHHPVIRHADPSGSPRRYMARTPVSYYDQTGALLKGSPSLPSSNEDDFAIITDTLRGTHGIPVSWFTPPNTRRTNSLVTMSLHSALRCKDQDDLTIPDLRYHIGEPIPPVADALLKQAELNNGGDYGEFKKCHVCRREYVIARAEWIEWWSAKPAVVLPFKVQVCSWGCVPDAILQRPKKDLGWK